MKIAIINGPNLNLLGDREPHIYGNTKFEIFLKELKEEFSTVELDYYQSNHEGDIIDKLQECGFSYDGIILNPAAYAHTSIAIADTVRAINTDVVEVHISNVYQREPFRRKSYVSAAAKGVICGFGLDSYRLAIHFFVK